MGRRKLTPEEKQLRALQRKQAKHTSESSGAVQPPEQVPSKQESIALGLAQYEEEWKKQAAVPLATIQDPEDQTQKFIQLIMPTPYKIDDATDGALPELIAKDHIGWVPIE